MSRRKHLLVALALSLSAAPACDEAIEGDFGDDLGEIAFRPGGFGTSGIFLNTNAIGDHPFSELDRLGNLHEGTELKEVRIRIWYKEQWMFFPLDEVWVEKGELVGVRGKTVYRGNQFFGSQWYINTYSGGLVERQMFITGYKFDNALQLHKYEFSYPDNPAYGQHYYRKLLEDDQQKPPKGAKFLAACVDENGSMDAVVYENLHVDMDKGDVSTKKDLINIACLSGAVGKAATFGYPFYEVGEEIFETGVRMIRADYLGDGNSWTMAGTAIEVYDVKGINDFADPTHKDEAMWTRDGAACINQPRRAEFTQTDVMAEGIPPCKDEKISSFPGALMWTKVPPPV